MTRAAAPRTSRLGVTTTDNTFYQSWSTGGGGSSTLFISWLAHGTACTFFHFHRSTARFEPGA